LPSIEIAAYFVMHGPYYCQTEYHGLLYSEEWRSRPPINNDEAKKFETKENEITKQNVCNSYDLMPVAVVSL
jgi:hypothetical protein